jgi:hypothetical protein
MSRGADSARTIHGISKLYGAFGRLAREKAPLARLLFPIAYSTINGSLCAGGF